MRGQGHIYKRGRIWWMKFYRNGKAYQESSHSEDRAVAEKLLESRVEQRQETEQTILEQIAKLGTKMTALTLGAFGEIIVAAELLNHGFDVFRSISPNASCDLVAVKKRRVYRIEVKTTTGRYPSKPRNMANYDVLATVSPSKMIQFVPDILHEIPDERLQTGDSVSLSSVPESGLIQ